MKRKLSGIVQSARLGMSPTLVTNALAVWVCTGHLFPRGQQWGEIAWCVLMGFCFFLYGMWENDRVDARWDARNRPNRPVPRGDISVWDLRVASFIAGICGLLLSSMLLGNPFPGVLLIVVISLYNWLHKAFSFSIILMGMCRGIWVLLAALAFSVYDLQADPSFEQLNELAIHYSFSLALYTMIASLVARGEAHNPVRKTIAGILLSGMSLHDAVWLLCLGQWGLALIAVGCYAFSLVLRKLKQRTT